MQIHATWASSSLILLKNRDKGTVMLLPYLIILCNKGEEEQHVAEPDIVDSKLETTFIDARWPDHDHILTVGLLKLPILEGPAADTLPPWIFLVPYHWQKSRVHPQMSAIFCRRQQLQSV